MPQIVVIAQELRWWCHAVDKLESHTDTLTFQPPADVQVLIFANKLGTLLLKGIQACNTFFGTDDLALGSLRRRSPLSALH